MLIHDFYLIKKDDLDFDNLKIWIIDKEKILYGIKISDDYILENASCFGKSAKFSSSFRKQLEHRIEKGLSYYGTTVLYGEDITDFLTALLELPDCNEKEMLLKIARLAIEKGYCIVHIGV